MPKLTESPRCFAVIGDPISHSLSPVIHSASFKAQKINAVYIPLRVAPKDLKRLPLTLSLMDIEGCNVTTPHKQTVIPFLDKIDSSARTAGSVNTIYRRGKTWVGGNTDGVGFINACKAGGIQLRSKSITIIGAGGTAAAIAAALMTAGVRRIIILNRTLTKAQKLIRRLRHISKRVELLGAKLSSQNYRVYFASTDILVHATSQGIQSLQKLKVPFELLPQNAVLCDCQYSRQGDTDLIRWAMRNERRFITGEDLLLSQAAESYFIWIKKKPNLRAMRAALNGAKLTHLR